LYIIYLIKGTVIGTFEIESEPILFINFDSKAGFKNKKFKEAEEEMPHQRHMYETAFDCKINKLENDFDDIDRMTNHLLISQVRLI
jgi:hypothetical protein